MKHFLTVIVPDKKAVKYALKGNIISIGRSEDNAICLGVSAVSSHHLEIHKSDSGYRLIDLDSTNGTSVNGERASDHQLANGDELVIGTAIRAKYEAVADESTAATSPAAAIPPRTVAQPAEPATPTVVLKKAPTSITPPAPAAEDPPTEIKIRKMSPPGTEEAAAAESAPPEAETPPEQESVTEAEAPTVAAPKLNIPAPGQQGAGPKKLNLG